VHSRRVLGCGGAAMKSITDTIMDHAPEGYVLSEIWIYKDATGKGVGAVARYDLEVVNGERAKQFRPFVREGEEIVCKGFPEPRPLYGLDNLAAHPEAPVLVVEGERTADAAGKLFPDHVVVTSPNGSKAASKADWKPLDGRQVTIWPDHDTPGVGYAEAVAKIVPQARVVVLPDNLPDAWDLADDLPAGMANDDLVKLIDGAAVIRESHNGGAKVLMFPGGAPAPTDEEVMRLAALPQIEYEQIRVSASGDLGVRVSVLDSLVREAGRKLKAMGAEAPVVDIATLAASAADIIASRDVLGMFAMDWRKGIAGEEKNAKLLYLVATSRLFKKTMHAAIKGPSSGGKSEIRGHVLAFFPPVRGLLYKPFRKNTHLP
jgi:hypothetical protein